jgi:hypothetical protein
VQEGEPVVLGEYMPPPGGRDPGQSAVPLLMLVGRGRHVREPYRVGRWQVRREVEEPADLE